MTQTKGYFINIQKVSFLTSVYSGTCYLEKLNKKPEKDWFDASAWLGKKGHRYHSEAVKYTLAAASQIGLLEGSERSAAIIATDTIDQSVRIDIASKLWNKNSETIGAAFAPNSSVNIAAGQLSSKYKLQGPCYTFTGSGEASCIALWQALRCINRGDISSALVGQVEYVADQKEKCGAILWLLSSQKSDEHLISIKSVQWQHWLPEYNYVFELSESHSELENINSHIYLIGNNSHVVDELMKQLSAQNYSVEHIRISAFEENLLPTMKLFSIFSYIVLQQIIGTVLLVSDNGHIFNFKLN